MSSMIPKTLGVSLVLLAGLGAEAAIAAPPAAASGVSASAAGYSRVAGLGRQPRAVAGFVDSIGVNVHLGYADTAYGDFDRLAAALRELGVRHVRDGLDPDRPDTHRRLAELGRMGISSQLLMESPAQDRLPRLFAALADPDLRASVRALEGPNEYDLSGDPNWMPRLRDYQQRLYAGVKRDPRLAALPVVGPSLSRIDSREQFGSIASSLDFGNVHPYPNGDPADFESLRYELGLGSNQSGSARAVITETGYHNAVRSDATHLPASEAAAAVYVPRALLDYYAFGVRRSFLYELLDQRPDSSFSSHENHFGLLRSDYSRKPSFVALRNLIDVLRPRGRPRGKPPSAQRLRVSTRDPDLRRVLLRRGPDLFVVLWRDVRVWDRFRRVALPTGTVPVRLALPRSTRAVDVYRPSATRRSTRSCRSRTKLRVGIGAAVTVIRLSSKQPAAPRRPCS